MIVSNLTTLIKHKYSLFTINYSLLLSCCLTSAMNIDFPSIFDTFYFQAHQRRWSGISPQKKAVPSDRLNRVRPHSQEWRPGIRGSQHPRTISIHVTQHYCGHPWFCWISSIIPSSSRGGGALRFSPLFLYTCFLFKILGKALLFCWFPLILAFVSSSLSKFVKKKHGW